MSNQSNTTSLFDYYDLTEEEVQNNPKVCKILQELTPPQIEQQINQIHNTQLPKDLKDWISQYRKVGKRDNFIWQWLWNIFQIIKLPIIDTPKQQREVLKQKVLLTMFVVLMDDAAEEKQDQKLLQQITKIPFQDNITTEKLNAEKTQYIQKSISLWKYLWQNFQESPNFNNYRKIFKHDFSQTIDSINYSYIVNQNYHFINSVEAWHFLPYNMNIFAYSDLDLMFTHSNYNETIGGIREVLYKIQTMARIGNWLSTWEREAKEKDFANGVIMHAVEDHQISIDDLEEKRGKEIIQIVQQTSAEKKLLKKWEDSYNAIISIIDGNSQDDILNQIIDMPTKMLKMHLSSKGYK